MQKKECETHSFFLFFIYILFFILTGHALAHAFALTLALSPAHALIPAIVRTPALLLFYHKNLAMTCPRLLKKKSFQVRTRTH